MKPIKITSLGVNVHNLRQVVEALDGAIEDAFNMAMWHCRTSACALGHACLIPELKMDGLFLSPNSGGDSVPMFGSLSGTEAGAEFFGLTRFEARMLFLPASYGINGTLQWNDEIDEYDAPEIEPAQVAERIDWIISDRKRAI